MEGQLRTQLEEQIQTRIREELRGEADYAITPFTELERTEEAIAE